MENQKSFSSRISAVRSVPMCALHAWDTEQSTLTKGERTMALEVDTVTGPAYWACALINDDASSLDEHENALCDAWAEWLAKDGWYVVDVVEDSERFTSSYNIYSRDFSGPTGGDVVDYVVHKQV
jgi:hypothetical protein